MNDLKAAIERAIPSGEAVEKIAQQCEAHDVYTPVAQPQPPPVRVHKHVWLDLSTHNDAGMRKAVCRDCQDRWYQPRNVPLPVTS